MKKTIITGLAIGSFLGCVATITMANTISYSEVYNPDPDILMIAGNASGTQTWTFNITDNLGWNTPGQLFNNGTISLLLEDDRGSGDGDEKATFTFDGGIGPVNSQINSGAWSGLFSVDASKFSDGMISATLTAISGDFYFRSATLAVTSNYTPQTDPSTPVPEPTTMLLMGTGLTGLVALRRRREKKKKKN